MTEKTTELFELKLHGDGISIDKQVDRPTALAVMAAVLGGKQSQNANTSAQPNTVTSSVPPMSVREYLTESTASTNNEHIAAIGLFLRVHRGQDTFSKDDAKAGFRSAHEPLPKNLSRDFGRTVQSGWIDEADEPGQYYVTNTGSKAIEDCFGRRIKAAG